MKSLRLVEIFTEPQVAGPPRRVEVVVVVGPESAVAEFKSDGLGFRQTERVLFKPDKKIVVMNPLTRTFWIEDFADETPEIKTSLVDTQEIVEIAGEKAARFQYRSAIQFPELDPDVAALLDVPWPKEIIVTGEVWLATEPHLSPYARTLARVFPTFGAGGTSDRGLVLRVVPSGIGSRMDVTSFSLTEEETELFEVPVGYREVSKPEGRHSESAFSTVRLWRR